MPRFVHSTVLTLCVSGSFALFGCGGGAKTVQEKRTVDSAQTGAAIGAVGGVLVGLVSGNRNLGDAALAGGAIGAAAGATTGAVAGGVEEAELKEKIGEANYKSLMYLVNGQHGFALDIAQKEQTEGATPEYRLAAYWLDAVITADLNDSERLPEVLDLVVDEDPDITSIEEARKQTKRLLMRVRDLRVEMGKPRTIR